MKTKKLCQIFFAFLILTIFSLRSVLAYNELSVCQENCPNGTCVQDCGMVSGRCQWVCQPASAVDENQGITNPALEVFGQGKGAPLLARLLGQVINTLFLIGGVLLLLMLLWSGYEWMTAGGDKERLASAQRRLTNAIAGFVLLVSARTILGFLAGRLGISWLQSLKIELPTP